MGKSSYIRVSDVTKSISGAGQEVTMISFQGGQTKQTPIMSLWEEIFSYQNTKTF